jgi:chromatin modification-related protein VID21
MDFREERKWKLMLAYNVATAVLEWHAAGSLAERVARNICVLWKRPKAEEVGDVAASANDRMEIDDAPAEGTKSNTLAMVDYGSEDEDDDEIDKSVVDALEPIALVQDVLDGADGTIQNQRNQPRDDGRETVQPKIEDIDDSSALQGGQVDEAMDIDMQPFDDPTGQENNTKEEHPSPTLGLKTTSTNPVLGSKSNSRSTFGDSDISASSKPTSKPNMYAPLRELIAYSDDDKIFLAVDDLSRLQGGSAPSTEDDILKPETLPPPDLSSIFPDLHPLTLLDVVPLVVAGTLAEGKKRSEKRSDKDDPNKRAEDVTYSKLAPTGQFMYSKPTLLGPLQPAKYWKNGRWLNLDESMAVSESDSPSIRTVDENMCGEIWSCLS